MSGWPPGRSTHRPIALSETSSPAADADEQMEMRTMNGNHLKYMLFAGAGLFAVLLATGSSLGNALLLALVLACPLMMFFMMSGDHSGHGSGHDHGDTPGTRDDTAEHTDPTRKHHQDT